MRRAQSSNAFEVVIKAPTLGLYTRIPGEQPDPRAATAASNVRFAEGVARNAPGYGILVTSPVLPKVPVLFQQTVVENGGRFTTSVVIGTANKLYSLFRYPDDYVLLTGGQHDFETESVGYGFLFRGGSDLWAGPDYSTPLITFQPVDVTGADPCEEYDDGTITKLLGGFGWLDEINDVYFFVYSAPVGYDDLETYDPTIITSLTAGSLWASNGTFFTA